MSRGGRQQGKAIDEDMKAGKKIIRNMNNFL